MWKREFGKLKVSMLILNILLDGDGKPVNRQTKLGTVRYTYLDDWVMCKKGIGVSSLLEERQNIGSGEKVTRLFILPWRWGRCSGKVRTTYQKNKKFEIYRFLSLLVNCILV